MPAVIPKVRAYVPIIQWPMRKTAHTYSLNILTRLTHMIVTSANIYVVPCGNRRGVILELETDSGISGLGEVGIAYGAGTMAAAEMAREMVQRFVLGEDPGPVELIWHTIYDNGFWTKGGGAISYAGLSALDHALW